MIASVFIFALSRNRSQSSHIYFIALTLTGTFPLKVLPVKLLYFKQGRGILHDGELRRGVIHTVKCLNAVIGNVSTLRMFLDQSN